MKITKHEHACIVLEELGQQLVIDPGEFMQRPPTGLHDVIGIVVTHKHPDHLGLAHVKALAAAYPQMVVFAPQDVLDELHELPVSKVAVTGGASQTCGSFELDFYGHDHAVVYQRVPCQNVGLVVNKHFYYPGDSFVLPEAAAIDVLAVPAGAPWMKMQEAIEFVHAVKPKVAFATHDGLFNDFGLAIAKNWLVQAVESVDGAYADLGIGDSYELK